MNTKNVSRNSHTRWFVSPNMIITILLFFSKLTLEFSKCINFNLLSSNLYLLAYLRMIFLIFKIEIVTEMSNTSAMLYVFP